MNRIPASLSAWLEHPFTPQREFAYSIKQWWEWVSIFRTRHDRVGSKFWWSAPIIVLPLIGPAAWFLLGAPPLR